MRPPEKRGIFNFEQEQGSIQLHLAPTRRREVQILYHNLLHLMQQHPSLSPSEVIVMAPQIDEYVPYIQSLFGSQRKFFGFSNLGSWHGHSKRERSGLFAINQFEREPVGCDAASSTIRTFLLPTASSPRQRKIILSSDSGSNKREFIGGKILLIAMNFCNAAIASRAWSKRPTWAHGNMDFVAYY